MPRAERSQAPKLGRDRAEDADDLIQRGIVGHHAEALLHRHRRPPLLFAEQVGHDPGETGPTGPTRAVHVIDLVVAALQVHDQRHRSEIEAPGREIRRHQDAGIAESHGVDRRPSRCTGHRSVERNGVSAVVGDPAGPPVRGMAGPDEHDRPSSGVEKRPEIMTEPFTGDLDAEMGRLRTPPAEALGRPLHVESDTHDDRVRTEPIDEQTHRPVEGRRDQQRPRRTRHETEDRHDVVDETEVGEPVGLVDHHRRHRPQVDLTPTAHVEQPSRCRDHHVGATGDVAQLRVERDPTLEEGGSAVETPRDRPDHPVGLLGQFAGGGDHHDGRWPERRRGPNEIVEDDQEERHRLARPGRRLEKDIASRPKPGQLTHVELEGMERRDAHVGDEVVDGARRHEFCSIDRAVFQCEGTLRPRGFERLLKARCGTPAQGPSTVVAVSAEQAEQAAPESAGRRRGRRPVSVSGDETRERIVQAAIDTLDAEGIVGTSARAIARRGAFNQALIFYHFGSVDGLLIEAARAEGTKRAVRYTESLAKVSNTRELIAVAHEIHRHEQSSGSVNVLAQLLAGANASPELREGIHLGMEPWMALVQEAIVRVLRGSSITALVDPADATYAVASLFIGMELMALLDPSRDRPETLFAAVARLAPMIDAMLAATPAAPAS